MYNIYIYIVCKCISHVKRMELREFNVSFKMLRLKYS